VIKSSCVSKQTIHPCWLGDLATRCLQPPLAAEIRKRLKDFSPSTDNLGNVYITVGSGAPHRLIVTPIDEPGYVIRGITEDGYLRAQRLSQRAPNEVVDALEFAEPVTIETRTGRQVPGVFAGLSVRLQPGRQNAPKMTILNRLAAADALDALGEFD
jgi:putative aminopeptidase FrvX